MFRLIATAFLAVTLLLPAQSEERRVALELVLAVDTSTSVDEREFELQRRGLADAFSHPDLIAVIEGMGDFGIAVALIEWAGTGQQEIVVDWSLINSRDTSLNFANKVRSANRPLQGMTDIGSVLQFSIDEFDRNDFNGNRRVIDVSGDGTSSVDTSEVQRDRAISRGITINGLVIFNKEYDLGELAEIDLIQHYSNRVIGGPGAFLMTAQNFEDFREAILNKLLREILGTTTAKASNGNQIQ